MKLTIRGNKLEVTEAIKNYVEEKLGKLDKYFENADELSGNVLLRVQGKEQIVEVANLLELDTIYLLKGDIDEENK